uniref:Ribosomal RNA-processing protein 8 n=1 Tax=Aplanochytrium stocchinoi TaxID=215587 RepID=A0A7S3PQP7_9STRA
MECIAIRKGKGGKKKHREGKSKGKKQNKNNNNRKKAQKHDNSNQHAAESNTQAKGKKRKRGQGSSLTKLQEKFRQKLEGSQFRWLNEELYTKTSEEAYRMIQDNTALFNVYHNGFESQVSKWPENPVDTIIDFLRTLPSSRCIGDFGCGDARIARTLADHMNLIHSFDLAKANKHVTVCNIKHVPLKNETLDVAIFCLSLMGIDFADFIKEANRVLKVGGTLIIAEVKSRFTQQNIDGKVAKGIL